MKTHSETSPPENPLPLGVVAGRSKAPVLLLVALLIPWLALLVWMAIERHSKG